MSDHIVTLPRLPPTHLGVRSSRLERPYCYCYICHYVFHYLDYRSRPRDPDDMRDLMPLRRRTLRPRHHMRLARQKRLPRRAYHAAPSPCPRAPRQLPMQPPPLLLLPPPPSLVLLPPSSGGGSETAAAVVVLLLPSPSLVLPPPSSGGGSEGGGGGGGVF